MVRSNGWKYSKVADLLGLSLSSKIEQSLLEVVVSEEDPEVVLQEEGLLEEVLLEVVLQEEVPVEAQEEVSVEDQEEAQEEGLQEVAQEEDSATDLKEKDSREVVVEELHPEEARPVEVPEEAPEEDQEVAQEVADADTDPL